MLITAAGEEIPFAIDIACSGLYSLMGFLIFSVFVSYIIRGSYFKKLLIFAIGLPLIFALNILRITIIIIIAFYQGVSLALDVFHFMGGWSLTFIGTFTLLLLSEKILKVRFISKTQNQCSTDHSINSVCGECGKILEYPLTPITKNGITKIILVFIIIFIVVNVQVPVFTRTEGINEVYFKDLGKENETTTMLPEVQGFNLSFVYRDKEFEEIARQNASLMYMYRPNNEDNRNIWVGIEIGDTKGVLHPWEVCLIGWPQTRGGIAKVEQVDLRDIHLSQNPPLSARYFTFKEKNSNRTQVVLYWYTRSGFNFGTKILEKWSKISVIAYTYNPNEYKEIEEQILPIANSIIEYRKPIQMWSYYSMFFAQNGSMLIKITMAALIVTTLFYILLNIRNILLAKNTYNKIKNNEDLFILEAIKSIKIEIPTLENISNKYKMLFGKDVAKDELLEKLREAEEIKILNKQIMNIEDEPYIVWKMRSSVYEGKLNWVKILPKI
jgi:exosortase/archaeosortase family protein